MYGIGTVGPIGRPIKIFETKKYHFGLHSKHSNLEEKFGDVKFVFMGGSEGRITKVGFQN